MIEELINALSYGEENAIHMGVLASRLGVSVDSVKAIVRSARRDGHCICSGKAGYWLPANDEEIEHTQNMFRLQAFSRLKSIKAMMGASNTQKDELTPIERILTGVSESGEK